jgi:hypothetical protein
VVFVLELWLQVASYVGSNPESGNCDQAPVRNLGRAMGSELLWIECFDRVDGSQRIGSFGDDQAPVSVLGEYLTRSRALVGTMASELPKSWLRRGGLAVFHI